MKAITYSEAQKNLRAVIQDVCKNSEPTIIVSSKDDAQAVLISLDGLPEHGRDRLSVTLTGQQRALGKIVKERS